MISRYVSPVEKEVLPTHDQDQKYKGPMAYPELPKLTQGRYQGPVYDESVNEIFDVPKFIMKLRRDS